LLAFAVARGKLPDQMSNESLLFAPANFPFRPIAGTAAGAPNNCCEATAEVRRTTANVRLVAASRRGPDLLPPLIARLATG